MRLSRVMGCVLALPAWAALIAYATLCAPRARAASPRAYSVELVATGMDAIDDTLAASSQLRALRKSAPVNAYGLIARARSDRDRLKTVLESFGYYDGSVSITIDGETLDDPRLGPRLSRLAPSAEAHVRIAFTLGALYRIGRIRIDGAMPASARAALAIAPGAPAVASKVLAAREQLQTELQDRGYAFADVAAPDAVLDPQQHALDLTFHVTTGPRVKIGSIHFQGLGHTREWLVRRRLVLHPGELYDAANVDRARRRLLDLGLFSSVSVELGKLTADGRVPITFQLKERSRHTVALSAAYSSDLGGSGGVSWNDRNLLGRADELDLSATIINFGGTATTGLGYNTSAKYILPDVRHRGDDLQFALSGLKQTLQAYDQRSESAGVTLSRRISSVWSTSVGFSLQQESVDQQQVTRDYTLAELPVRLIYDSTDRPSPLSDPTHGTRGALNLTPTYSLLGRGHPKFAILQASVAHYFDFSPVFAERPGRTMLALRVMAGVAFGASQFSLPPDQRFYAGGSGTIRGYRYQSVGPQFISQNGILLGPVGGTAMDAVNVELRQRIGRHFGAVVFVDGGGVSEGHEPFSTSLSCTESKSSSTTGAITTSPSSPSSATAESITTSTSCIGVGAGVLYYTPIGPIRLDVALPTVRRQGDDRFEIYVGLGQAF